MDYMVLRTGAQAAIGASIRTMSGAESQPDFNLERESVRSDRQLAALRSDPRVRSAAPVMPTRLVEPLGADDEEAEAWGIAAIGCEESTYTGEGVTVAILDTGIESGHAAFKHGPSPELKNFTEGANNDESGHGTHCAGVIFGGTVKGRRLGVAPGVARRMVGKVVDGKAGDTRMLFEGINWAIAGGANVIALSLGIDIAGMIEHEMQKGLPERYAASRVLDAYRENLRLFDALIDIAANPSPVSKNGAVVVAAAGNESRGDLNKEYRASPTLPAAARGVTSVGALRRVDGGYDVAYFSNSSPRICAPGVDILSAGLEGSLVGMSGTSMACPHVAGAAALWWQALSEQGYIEEVARHVRSHLEVRADTTGLADVPISLRGRGLVKVPI